MSKPAKAKEPEGAEAPAGGGKKKGLLLIIGLVVLLVLGGGGAAAFFLLGGKKDGEAHETKKAKKHGEPVFVTLEPFVVNLAGDVQHYLQVGIDLKVADGKAGEDVKVHLPEVRNAVLLLLSSKKPEDLASMEQKNALRDEIRVAVNDQISETPKAQRKGKEAEKGEKGKEGEKGEKGEKAGKGSKEDREEEAEGGVEDVLLTSLVIQ